MNDNHPLLDNAADLKALAHPLRVRIFYALRSDGRATASQLGELLGESPALLSYHLRELAKRGFVTEEVDAEDRRRRWWSLKARGYSYSSNATDLPTRLAATALSGQLDDYTSELLERYRATREAWGQEWREAAFEENYLFRLTPAEFVRLHDEMAAVLKRWTEVSDGRDAPDGASRAFVFAKGFPYQP